MGSALRARMNECFVLPVLPTPATSAEGARNGNCINIQKQEGFAEKFGGRFFEKVAAKFFWEAALC